MGFLLTMAVIGAIVRFFSRSDEGASGQPMTPPPPSGPRRGSHSDPGEALDTTRPVGPRPQRGSGAPERRDAHHGTLMVKRVPAKFESEDGSSLPITNVLISGSVFVPHDRFPVSLTVRLHDVTESAGVMDFENFLGVHCGIHDLQDEMGGFFHEEHFEVPYESTSLSDAHVVAIPDFALTLARKGRRRLAAFVFISPGNQPDLTFTDGSVEFDFDNPNVGYLEWEDHLLEQEEHLVAIAVAASAVDGRLENAEIDSIKQFFGSRYDGRDDAAKWKKRASASLKANVSDLQANRTSPGTLLTAATTALREAAEPDAMRTAFEVAVRAVASDGVVNEKEESLLIMLAKALDLSTSAVKEIRDRNLRASMFGELEDEVVLGMPPGLDDDAKRKWLATEYSKWRGRVSHANAEIAAEANIRLERITKLRTKLGTA